MAKYELNYEALDEETKKKNNSNKNGEEALEWIETVIYAFFIVIVIFTFLLRIANVDGESMLPTLNDGDRLIVSHIMYSPDNGDIVIVNSDGLNKAIVKRVIAVEGQTVDIDFNAGTVKVDGNVLEESYINEITKLDEGGHQYPVTVPANCVFVMGDNRNNSTDSRDERVGFVPVDDILGKVVLRIFPFDSIGVPAQAYIEN